ncbi:MAG: hypothetical protein HY561_09735 [Gemmatimonadetes bacterium]|nr:hypothetical protein [Gemmatimonadota bacterium]
MIPSYAYAHEKLDIAIACLMIPVASAAEAIACAMAELRLAFYEEQPPHEAKHYIREIETIMAGPGTWEERAAGLSDPDVRRLSRAFHSLDRLMTRLYYEALYGRSQQPATS